MHIALTGITGFVGKVTVHSLLQHGCTVRALVRSMPEVQISGVEYVVTGDYTQVQEWAPLLQGVDGVIHLAAFAHQMKGASEADYFRVNVDVTQGLIHAAQACGVQKFVFLSSVKVLGEETPIDQPFTNVSTPNPQDAYGRSKYAAEQLVQQSGLNYVILRPPLIYGEDVKGNLRTLQKLLKMRVPLPLASIDNKRSIVDVEHVADMLLRSIETAEWDCSVQLITSGEYSTPDLIRRIGADIGVKPVLLPFPPALLRLACELMGKRGVWQRLGGSLVVTPSSSALSRGSIGQ